MLRTNIPRFQIGAQFGDGVDFLDFFSSVLNYARSEQKRRKRFEIPFALLFRLSKTQIRWSELEELYQSKTPVWQWAKTRVWRSPDPKYGMFWALLGFCLQNARQYGIHDGAQVCRALAAVGQTLNGKNSELRTWNRELAAERRASAAARPRDAAGARQPTSSGVVAPCSTVVAKPHFLELERKDERGQYLGAGNLAIWHASFIGPNCAQKTENQDATAARIVDSGAVFALADGVTTSLGARIAAAAVAHQFCELGPSLVGPWNGTAPRVVLDGISKALDDDLCYLLAHPDSKEFIELCGRDFQPASAKRLLENTRTGKNPSMPAALSATLVAGVVLPGEESGQFQINLLRVGDGLVEHIDQQGRIEQILTMDPGKYAISTALGPGPRARSEINAPGAYVSKTVCLKRGEFLLVSSDGLTRGHQEPVAAKLNELLERDTLREARQDDQAAAIDILRSVCLKADELSKEEAQPCLFADNVSLILVASLRG